MSDEPLALPAGDQPEPGPTLEALMEEYPDLADAPPERLEEVRAALADAAWREALAEAERRKVKEHPFGGLADLACMVTLTARTGNVERLRMKALDVERAALELLEEIDQVALTADDFMDRDPARGDDAEERKRLTGERASLLTRLAEHSPTVATKAARLRELL